MRVVVPYTDLREQTRAALDESGFQWEPVDVSGSDSDYFELVAGLWAAGETFCLVEHDVIPGPGSLAELEACEQPWCAFDVRYGAGLWAGLSCVKFADQAIAAVPGAVEQVGAYSDERHPPRHWCRLDVWLQGTLLAHGLPKCVHSPALEHVRAEDGPIRPAHAACR